MSHHRNPTPGSFPLYSRSANSFCATWPSRAHTSSAASPSRKNRTSTAASSSPAGRPRRTTSSPPSGTAGVRRRGSPGPWGSLCPGTRVTSTTRRGTASRTWGRSTLKGRDGSIWRGRRRSSAGRGPVDVLSTDDCIILHTTPQLHDDV